MYSTSYTATAVSLREKWLLYHFFAPERRISCCCCCFCCNGVTTNPRYLYGYMLKQSALIQWPPSRKLLAGGIRRCLLGSDVGFREMIGLLVEYDGLCSEDRLGSLANRRSRGRKDLGGFSCYSESSWFPSEDSVSEEDRGRNGGKSLAVRRKNSYPVDVQDVDEKDVCQIGKYENVGARDSRKNAWVGESGPIGGAGRISSTSNVTRRESAHEERGRRDGYQEDDKKKITKWKDRVVERKDEYRGEYGRKDQHFVGKSGSRERLQKRECDVGEDNVKRVSLSLKRASGLQIRDVEDSMDLGYELRERYVEEDHSAVGRRDLREGTRKTASICEVSEDDRRVASSSKNMADKRKVDTGSSSSSVVKRDCLVDIQAAEIAASKISSRRFAEVSERHDIGTKSSSLSQRNFEEKRVRSRENQFTSAQVTEDKKVQMDQLHHRVDQQVYEHAQSKINSGSILEISEMHDNTEIKMSALSQGQFDEARGSNMQDQSASVQHSVQVVGDNRNKMDQQHRRVLMRVQDHGNFKVSSERLDERLENRDNTNKEGYSLSQRQFDEARASNMDDQSILVQQSVQEVSNTRIQMHNTVKETDVTKLTKEFKNDTNIYPISNSQKHFEDVRDRREKSTSARKTVHDVRDDIITLDQQVADRVNTNKQHESCTNVAGVLVSNTQTISSSQRVFGASDQENNVTSDLDLVQKVREKQNQSSQQASQQYSLRNAHERSAHISEGSRTNIRQSMESQKTANTRTEAPRGSPPFMLVQGRKEKKFTFNGRRSQSRGTQTTFVGSSDSSFNSGYSNFQEQANQASMDETYLVRNDILESARQLDKSSSHYGEHFVDDVRQEISSSDETNIESKHSSGTQTEEVHRGPLNVLESARQLDKSSSLYVEEFVDKIRQEISSLDKMNIDSMPSYGAQTQEVHRGSSRRTMDVQLGASDNTSKYNDYKNTQRSARQSSSRSAPKGPWNEMWEIGPSSSEEPLRIEAEEHSSPMGPIGSTSATGSEGTIIRRSHRSLWTYIADIIRKGWGSSADSHRSTLKSVIRSSSRDSISSEAWFSGHEPDEEDTGIEIGHSSSPKATTPEYSADYPFPKEHSVGSLERFETPVAEETVMLLEGNRTTLAKVPEGGSLPTPTESAGLAENGTEVQALSSSTEICGTSVSVSLTGHLASPSVEEEITLVENLQMSKNESSKPQEELQSDAGQKQMELKQRKLQRNKQVLKETFEEWEEAYRLESEQRNIDEFFMREALVEGKKAADSWEVPVGAVLVQNGKIIARGCNLVEELRDSTAHAEIICIREASNILRTWRLSDTTLYVTLEPCPMCAGAILQARIDTVVWGAPNKLLGADGSWVRLFPGDGGSSLDASNQTAGPVHPFHPKMTVRRGVLAAECADSMQQFFKLRRKDKKSEPSPLPRLPISTHPRKLLTKMHDLFCMMFCL